jgi:hypothetical protein
MLRRNLISQTVSEQYVVIRIRADGYLLHPLGPCTVEQGLDWIDRAKENPENADLAFYLKPLIPLRL